MGMYTEIYVNVDLIEETPEEVMQVLQAMCRMDGNPAVNAIESKRLPSRWSYLFNDGSYYTPRTSCRNLTYDDISKQWSLLGKGDIKNYENEIEAFFDWLLPWVDGEVGDFVGYLRYEESPLPCIVLIGAGGIPEYRELSSED